jgi:hypothetical protein
LAGSFKDYNDAMIAAGRQEGLLSEDIEDMDQAVRKYGNSIVTKVTGTVQMAMHRSKMLHSNDEIETAFATLPAFKKEKA